MDGRCSGGDWSGLFLTAAMVSPYFIREKNGEFVLFGWSAMKRDWNSSGYLTVPLKSWHACCYLLVGFCSAGLALSSCAKEMHSIGRQKEYGSAFDQALWFQDPLSQLCDTVLEVLWLENGHLPSSSNEENFFVLYCVRCDVLRGILLHLQNVICFVWKPGR